MVVAASVTPRLSLWRSYAGFRYFVAASKNHQYLTRPARGQFWGGPLPAARAVLARRAHDAAERSRLQPSIAPGIELIMGPMFSGKSTELLRRVEELERAGLAVALVKSSKDNRYSQQHIVTHNGLTRQCYAVASLTAFLEATQEDWPSIQVIAVDEAQFIPDLRQVVVDSADREGKRWLLAGLDGDFQRERIGQMLDLIPQADKITKLHAHCQYCLQAGFKRAAPFTLRYAAGSDTRQEVVGGAEQYAPVCRHHYVSLMQRPRTIEEDAEQQISLGCAVGDGRVQCPPNECIVL